MDEKSLIRYSKGRCASCGTIMEVKEYHDLDRSRNPDITGVLMEEDFFMWECPQCGRRGHIAYPCWYFDPEEELGVALVPDIDSSTGAAALQGMNRNLEGLVQSNITRRAVGNFLALREQIAARYFGLDDRTVQLAKPLMIGQLQEEGKEVWNGYFVQILEDLGEEPPPGVLYLGSGEEEVDYSRPVYCYNVYLTDHTPMAVGVNEYAFQLCQELLDQGGAPPDDGRFHLYDLNWAIDFHNRRQQG